VTVVETVPEQQEIASAAEQRLQTICASLLAAGAGPFELQRCDVDDRSGPGRVVSGWSLAGGATTAQLRSAAKLVRELYCTEGELHSLAAEILERYEEATLVYRLSDRLGTVFGEAEISRLVLKNAADVLGARAGEIWLQDGDQVVLIATVPAHGARGWNPREQAVFSALRQARAWVREATEHRESVVAMPLPGPQDKPIGVLVLRGRTDGRSYRTGEVKLLSVLASLTASFIRNHRLAEEARRAAARRREDEIARQIHRSLLPTRDPSFAGLDIAGCCEAAENIGGDYYGYLRLPDGSIGLAMADVSGHGVGAGLFMAVAKGVLQAEARRVSSPADLLRRTNEALAEDFSDADMFATAFFARFYPGGRRLEYSNGGHTPPLLLRKAGGVELLQRGGAALGVMSDMSYEEETREFAEGDVLLIYTDGLTEARDEQRRFYKLDRLIELASKLRHEGAQAIRDRVLEDLRRHCAGRTPEDDVTVVVVRGTPHDDGDAR
jgi:sigma-B regulation protein RsbU (phosphoserine phosphatase)